MSRRIKDEVILQISQLKKDGMTCREISEITGVSISTVSRIGAMDGTTKREDNIHTYIPDYKMIIKPIKKRLECEYGGILFSVDLEKTELEILDMGIDIQGTFDENNIEELEHFGQALISISRSLKSIVVSESDRHIKNISKYLSR